MDWSFPPDLQKRYEEVSARIRQLQAEFGITPRTLEERYQDYQKRKLEEQKKAEELAKFKELTVAKRPPPKWKV